MRCPQPSRRVIDDAAIKPLVISTGVYHLMWDLAKSDLPSAFERGVSRTAHAALPQWRH